jgi:hypothetical protein
MLDGLGLVYEKQGNTGAAAYTPPSNTDPFAVVTNDLASQVDFQRKKKERDAIKQEELNNKIIEAINPEGWSLDNRQYFYKSGNDLKLEATLLKAKGKNLNDISDPEVMAFMEKSKKLNEKANLSAEQGKFFNDIYNDYTKNPDKYDQQVTAANIEKWQALPMEERFTIDPRTLVEPKFNAYAGATAGDLKDFDIFVDVSSKKGTRINEERINDQIQLMKNDPDAVRSYEQGIRRGEWKNQKEWEDAQRKFIKSRISIKENPEVKGPTIINNFGGGNIQDEETAIDRNNKTTMFISNVQGTGNINSTIIAPESLGTITGNVAPGNLYETNKGRSTRQTPIDMKTGSLGIALIHNNGSYVSEKDGVQITRGDKVIETLTTDEAIKRGIVRYQAVIFGNGTAPQIGVDGKVSGEAEDVPFIVKANAFVNSDLKTDAQGKPEGNTKAKVKKYVSEADKLNQEAGYGTKKGSSSSSSSSGTSKAQSGTTLSGGNVR